MYKQNSTSQPQIPSSSFAFLNELKQNNNREWFAVHKDEYLQELGHIEYFVELLLKELNTHDIIDTPSAKKSLFRIYRDTRFSKDKTPYKTNYSGAFRRATKYRRGGYYFHLEPGNSYIAGGFWAPNVPDLKRIREEIAFDAGPLRAIIESAQFVAEFETLKGDQLKTAPKGFDSAHPAIDLLRYKQFIISRKFTDEAVLSTDFATRVSATFKAMRPFFDYMSQTLTYDVNGIEL